ncbi:arylsulfatase A-like [Anneissia japonica]|uniref:arylsulfatase A-like n=1 Tax=Anneissia japonica TaxID=1529436 RepID=UPI001425A6F3|nr:arylsulfatase A-like [Anneissia japonica]
MSYLFCLLLLLFSSLFVHSNAQSKPNIVILFADDLGYGDLEVYGHPTSSTPNINQLAENGLRFTQFYSASPVCSPSRAALLTGRYQTRSGIWPGVFVPDDAGGLPLNETTFAEVLKQEGYKTAMVGKWHLGVGKDSKYLPTKQGFDHYFGIPYSHDMCPCLKCFYPGDKCFNDCDLIYTGCPLYNNTTIIDQPVDLLKLIERYVSKATDWIQSNAKSGDPFLLYFAFQHTHHPQFAGEKFRNSTLRGTFGDSLAELDWAVGEVMNQLRKSGVLENTFIFLTSDNGPSLRNQNRGGNAGLLKCGKGTTYEGGQRVPAIAYWTGKITPGRTTELASTLDLLPTISKITGASLPKAVIDGVDMSPILFGGVKGLRENFYYYFTEAQPKYGVYAVRNRQFKAHYYTEGQINSDPQNHDPDCRPSAKRTFHNPPLLFDLLQDPSEQYNLNNLTQYQAVITQLNGLKKAFEAGMVWGISQITKDHDHSVEPCCKPGCTPFPNCCQCHEKYHSHYFESKP